MEMVGKVVVGTGNGSVDETDSITIATASPVSPLDYLE